MCTAVEGWRGWRYWKGKGEEERVRLKMMGFLLSVERNGKWGRREGLQGREIIDVFERLAESLPAIPLIFFSSFSLFSLISFLAIFHCLSRSSCGIVEGRLTFATVLCEESAVLFIVGEENPCLASAQSKSNRRKDSVQQKKALIGPCPI